jgi:hypothetical protein
MQLFFSFFLRPSPRSLLLLLCPTPRVFNYTIILSDFTTTTTTVQRLSSVYVLYILWTFFFLLCHPVYVRTLRTAAVGWVQPIRVLFDR